MNTKNIGNRMLGCTIPFGISNFRAWRAGMFGGLLIAGLMLASCSKEYDATPVPSGETVAVEFSMDRFEETAPEAQEAPDTKAALETNTTVRVIAYKSSSDNPTTDNYVTDQAYYWNGSKLLPCTVTADGTFEGESSSQLILSKLESYDFYAITPAIELDTDHAGDSPDSCHLTMIYC